MTRSFSLIGTTALLALALLPTGCGVGSGGPESKISETTDTYLRSLASGDRTKACAQLTAEANSMLGESCAAAMQTIATRVAGKGSPRRPTKAPRSRSMAPPARRRSRD